MFRKIGNCILKLRIKGMQWKKIGKFHIDKGFNIIGAKYISIGNDFYAGENLRLQAWDKYENQSFTPILIIGSEVSMMENCQISCCNKILIGDGCLFGANVFMTDNFHGDNSIAQCSIAPIKRQLKVKKPIKIGKNVWIGRNVCIMPGVNIGDGAVVGANSVVTHDIPSLCVAVGIPAKMIKRID